MTGSQLETILMTSMKAHVIVGLQAAELEDVDERGAKLFVEPVVGQFRSVDHHYGDRSGRYNSSVLSCINTFS